MNINMDKNMNMSKEELKLFEKFIDVCCLEKDKIENSLFKELYDVNTFDSQINELMKTCNSCIGSILEYIEMHKEYNEGKINYEKMYSQKLNLAGNIANLSFIIKVLESGDEEIATITRRVKEDIIENMIEVKIDNDDWQGDNNDEEERYTLVEDDEDEDEDEKFRENISRIKKLFDEDIFGEE